MDDTTTRRWQAASGCLVILLGIAGASFERGSPPVSASIEETVAFWVRYSNELLAQSVMFVLSAGAYLWFFASLRSALVRTEGGTEIASSTAFGAGIVVVALQMALQGLQIALATLARGPLEPATVVFGASLMWAVSVIAYVPMAVVLAAVAVASLRYRAFPRWLGWFSAAGSMAHLGMTFGLVAETGPLSPGGSLTYGLYALTLVWLVAVTSVIAYGPKGFIRPWRSVRASRAERTRRLSGDDFIPVALDTLTHAITIQRPPQDVWPWLAQMGAGSRGGWYSYDWLDNRRRPSATRILSELQHPEVGTIFPALPGVTEGFSVLAIEPERVLVLGWLAPNGPPEVTWTFILENLPSGATRLLVRARGGPGYRFHGLPLLLTRFVVRVVHFIMQRRQLLGIARRAEVAMSRPSAFKTPQGEAAFLAAYDAAMKSWPVPYEDRQIQTRFGMTHVVASGPKDAPPLVLLHGYMATLTMWVPNIADFSKDYRVYAIDVVGQPSKSIPGEPIQSASDYVAWLTATLNGLHLDRVSLVGMSYGGWLALNYALGAPERVRKLALLSPAGSFLPLVRQFMVRGMLMVLFPTRFMVGSFMHWLGLTDDPFDLMYLGLKHFRMPAATVQPTAFSDEALRAMHVPTLLLIGEREVIYDPAAALARARLLVPDLRGELVPSSNHDMSFSQHEIVDSRVLEFLSDAQRDISERIVA